MSDLEKTEQGPVSLQEQLNILEKENANLLKVVESQRQEKDFIVNDTERYSRETALDQAIKVNLGNTTHSAPSDFLKGTKQEQLNILEKENANLLKVVESQRQEKDFIVNDTERYSRETALDQAIKVNLGNTTHSAPSVVVEDAQVFYDFLKGTK
jgi:hypothetical protein